ncbi:MAG: hypothetical protein WAU78_00405 [Roseiarcus sp.]
MGVGVLLLGIGVGLVVADLRGPPTPQHPELRIAMSGANVFVPDKIPGVTGIGLDAKIWNTGALSIVTVWSLVVIPNGAKPVVAQLTQMPNVLTANGPFNSARLLAGNSLEAKTKDTTVGDEPVSGVLLFYVQLPQDVVVAPNTVWTLIAKDAFEKETQISQLMGDWIQR